MPTDQEAEGSSPESLFHASIAVDANRHGDNVVTTLTVSLPGSLVDGLMTDLDGLSLEEMLAALDAYRTRGSTPGTQPPLIDVLNYQPSAEEQVAETVFAGLLQHGVTRRSQLLQQFFYQTRLGWSNAFIAYLLTKYADAIVVND